ncbi:hypothetical protein Fmac_020624 [Flemingia macrophylla]|uniref:Cytokinin dehydrogenase 1 FAD/cytokinin binding domain-containing protein n=1 Tax=Flemingia macrophylla TaxID=520843 RepID=A0ABD1LUM7_9FABA
MALSTTSSLSNIMTRTLRNEPKRNASYEEFLERIHTVELTETQLGQWDIPHVWLDMFIPSSRISDFNEGVLKGIVLKQNLSPGNSVIYSMNRNISSLHCCRRRLLPPVKKAAKKVLRYLQGTKDYMLTYKKSNQLEVVGYSDSDYAGCVDSRKSTYGYVYMLVGGTISWKSSKESVIATSTMEAEFVACFESTIHALWLWNFISWFGIIDSIARPLRIYCDNFAAIFFSKNDRYSKGAKHIDLKYLSVNEEVQKQRVSIEHIGTELMIADPLTKGLPPKTFIGHRTINYYYNTIQGKIILFDLTFDSSHFYWASYTNRGSGHNLLNGNDRLKFNEERSLSNS